ncbi:MAG: aspartate aminotransferase family protein [Promethearchaeota archaeon]
MVDSKEIINKDKEFYIQGYPRVPVVLVEGKGTILKDIDGKEYIDCLAGIAVNNVGHAPERLLHAATSQMSKLIHCSGLFYSLPQTLLAEKLAEITPGGLRHTFLCNSGVEAVENAVKLTKKFSISRGKTGASIIALECSFHGRLGYSLSLTGQSKYKIGFGTYASAPGVVHAPAPYYYRSRLSKEECAIEAATRVEEIITHHTTGDVGAMIIEPILGEGGMIVPPAEYFSTLQRILKEQDIPLIVDEVQTGFARTGKMFACEHWNLQPDLMTMAKGLGGGMPIGAVISTKSIADSVELGDFFSTFGGNPVSCAVALENIAILEEEELAKNAEKMGELIMSGLMELQQNKPLIGDIRGKGLMIGIELVKNQKNKTPAKNETTKLVERMIHSGILIGSGGIHKNVLRIQPPLCISEEQVNQVLEVLNTEISKL